MFEYKVSLIIPCYNVDSIDFVGENPFSNMIDSVISQSIGIENIEVLLVDDCSTDNTKNLLEELNNKYPNIKPIFLEENSGHPSIPRNVGIDNASADYVMFLDQDDEMDVDCVRRLYDEITDNGVDFVKANYSILMEDNILNYDTGKNERLIIRPQSEDMIYLVSHFMWGSIYDKNFLNKFNIRFPNSQAEDNLFLAKCYNHTNKDIIALNDYYSIVYTANNNNSLSHSFNLKQVTDYIRIYEETLNSYIKYNQSNAFISINIQRYIIILIGSLLRSSESFNVKKQMIENIGKFINEYKDYNTELPPVWKVYSVLIKHHFNILIHISSIIINYLFDNPIFTKFFRNKDYD